MKKLLKELKRLNLDYELIISNKVLKLHSDSIHFICNNTKEGRKWILKKLKNL